MQPGWCQPIRQEFMENECEAFPGVAYPGVRDNRSTLNTKTGYDDDDDLIFCTICVFCRLVVLVRLSVPLQVIDWKDSSPE